MDSSLGRRLTAEFLGSLVLVVAAIAPVILAHHVMGASVALAVLMDAVAVAFVLFALIEVLEPVSYCHINPAVTLAMMGSRHIEAGTGLLYMAAQFAGGLAGTLVSHLMFWGQDPFRVWALSQVVRSQGSYVGEFLGTFLLVFVIYGLMYKKSTRPGLVIGLLVGGLLMATSSTMFANPQVTLARIFTYSIGGIRPLDGAVFVVVECLAALAAMGLARFIFPPSRAQG